MSSQSSQRVFQLRQDPLTGNSEWIVIEDNDQPGTSTDGLLATTSYLDMLNDSRRNIAYRLAIEKTITEPCHVLDIGFVFSLSHFHKLDSILGLNTQILIKENVEFVCIVLELGCYQ
jgi:hypothetical protein